MAVVLGLISALCFGAGDFFGGLSAKRVAVVWVIALSHAIALPGVLIVALLFASEFSWADFGIGMAGGASGALGVALLYRGLARGPMAVVAPLTALTSAVVPALWGVIDGESFTALAWIGMGVAAIAIVFSSMPSRLDGPPPGVAIVAQSLLAGSLFGLMFVLFDFTSDSSAPWPVVSARILTAGSLIAFLFFRTRQGGYPVDRGELRRALPTIAAAGLLDTGSNLAFLYGTTLGDLAIVAVLSSLYPAITVLLAKLVLEERMSRLQLLGLGAAILASTLIALG